MDPVDVACNASSTPNPSARPRASPRIGTALAAWVALGLLAGAAPGKRASSTPPSGGGETPIEARPRVAEAPRDDPVEEPKRIRLRIDPGDSVVIARVYGRDEQGRHCVFLPDGQLVFARGDAFTDEPFEPATAEQMRDELVRGPFAGFAVKQSPHYLVLYQSTPAFAEASVRLLEDLYKNLTEALRKRRVPVHEPEFPLVAIIFKTERDFRRHKPVAADVQAYYELFSNRIYLYQKSERDEQSPEVAALRKPQTVAHEGTHQILQNIGVQPRLSDWPLWLMEGLAEYCASPVSTKKGAAWGGLGVVNALHMATIHDLDDPLTVQSTGRKAPPHLGRDPKSPLVEYLVTRTELTPTDYALSWALTHYLAMKRGTEFLAFLRTLGRWAPLEKRRPEDHLAAFRAAFGPDLARMDRTVAQHLSKLKYDPLPYYAVMFEQSVGSSLNRAVLVSQSPSVIRQWLDTMGTRDGAPATWQALPFPSRARALLSAEQWIQSR